MKKHIVLLLAALLLLSGCQAGGSSIRPEKFSKEAQEILETIGDTYFYTYTLGDEIKSFHIDYWTFTDGEWSRKTVVETPQVESRSARLGLRFEPETLYVYDEYGRYTMPVTMKLTVPDGCGGFSNPLMSAQDIVAGEDIILYQSIISPDGQIHTADLGSFAPGHYTDGVALTVTFCGEDAEA